MGQEYQFRVYFNTGFNRFNRPDSLTLLQTATSKVFASPYLRQDKFIQSVKIDASFQEVEGADYATIGTTAFFVTSIQMIADHTANLTLELDSIATVGVENISIIGGWVKRRHVVDDTLFANDINEPFQPRGHLQIDDGQTVGFSGTDQTFLATTISLRNTDLEKAKTYVDNAQNLTVTVPDVEPAPIETICSIPAISGSRHFQLPMTTIYTNLYGVSAGVDLKEAVGYLRALGLESAITASYIMPDDAYQASGNVPFVNECSQIIGKKKEVDTGLDFAFGSFKNNKVYSGQYTHYVLANIATGNQAEFTPEDLYNNNNNVVVVLYADPSPTGRPYCRPEFFRKDSNNLWISSIAGSQWLNAPIRFDESQISGFAKQMKQVTYNNVMIQADLEIAEFNTGMNILKGGVESAGQELNLLGLGAKALDLVSTFANRDLNREKARVAKERNIQTTIDLARPEIIFPMTDNMAAYYGHQFIMYRTRMTTQDMQRFDKFLTMYGYAVDEPFTADALTCRQKFNYITLQDAQIKTPGFGITIKEDVENIFAGGVRIWHKLPAAEDYNDNPIVEVTK